MRINLFMSRRVWTWLKSWHSTPWLNNGSHSKALVVKHFHNAQDAHDIICVQTLSKLPVIYRLLMFCMINSRQSNLWWIFEATNSGASDREEPYTEDDCNNCGPSQHAVRSNGVFLLAQTTSMHKGKRWRVCELMYGMVRNLLILSGRPTGLEKALYKFF